jgi:hypothetical protein
MNECAWNSVSLALALRPLRFREGNDSAGVTRGPLFIGAAPAIAN